MLALCLRRVCCHANQVQNTHRSELEKHGKFKRHEAGIIQNVVAQLYWDYYIHSGELNFLAASFRWYKHVWDRGYFNDINCETYSSLDLDDAAKDAAVHLYQKRLRFYQRFLNAAFVLRELCLIHSTLLPEYLRTVEEYKELVDAFWKDDADKLQSTHEKTENYKASVLEMKNLQDSECGIDIDTIARGKTLLCPERRLLLVGDAFLLSTAAVCTHYAVVVWRFLPLAENVENL